MISWRWGGMLLMVGGVFACATAAKPSSDDDDSSGTSVFTNSSSSSMQTSAGGNGGAASSNQASNVSSSSNGPASTAGPGPQSVVASSSSGMTGCAQMPTYEDCANCFCMQDQTGCQAYIDVIDNYLFCGAECGTECVTYCGSLDPLDITPQCDTCTLNFDCTTPLTTQMQQDCTNLQNACTANTACINFVTDLSTCP
jgi:hypothetical protein